MCYLFYKNDFKIHFKKVIGVKGWYTHKDDEFSIGYNLYKEFYIGKLLFVLYEFGDKKMKKKLYK